MSEPNQDLPTLLARVRQRDEDAARTLVERLHPLVARIVAAHLPRGEDEADLRQEVFLKIFSRLESFRGDVPFEHWVSRVTVNACIDQLRARRVRPSVVWSDLSPEQQHLLGERAEEQPAHSREQLALGLLQRLLEALAPAERALVRWLDLEEKTIAEVCALTGWNSGVVRIRAFRARRKLKRLYEALEPDQTGERP
jgi:RNA polymerase sigma factor (sigma-70 family)